MPNLNLLILLNLIIFIFILAVLVELFNRCVLDMALAKVLELQLGFLGAALSEYGSLET